MNFNRQTISVLTCLLLSLELFAQWPLRDTIEFQAREALPNFYRKVSAGETTKVAYFGGSVTEGQFWRPKTIEWMKSYFQNDSIINYNEAVGGTNSIFGAFRVDSEILTKTDFDLVFVEFAVNDQFFSESSNIEKSIEGIVRKIWLKNPYTDICFVYTVMSTFLPQISEGKMNLTASKHDSIAAHYGIPSIFWGVEYQKQLEKDWVIFYDPNVNLTTSKNDTGAYVLTKDRIHPTPYGTQIYVDVLTKNLKKIEHIKGVFKHNLKIPLWVDNFETSSINAFVDSSNYGMEVVEVAGVKAELNNFLLNGTRYLVTEDTNAYYEFDFTGSLFGINFITGPSVGKFVIEVDGVKIIHVAFDAYSAYYRRQYRLINTTCGKHHVRIYPHTNGLTLEEKENMFTAAWRIADIQNNPEKYDKNELIFSDILIFEDLHTPLITASSVNFCAGDSVELVSSYPIANTWSTGETSEHIWVKSEGQYSVTTSSEACVKVSEPKTITQFNSPLLNVASQIEPSSCTTTDGEINLSGIASGILTWHGQEQDSTIQITLPYTVEDLNHSTYLLTFTSGSCAKETIELDLFSHDQLTDFSISGAEKTKLCPGDSLLLSTPLIGEIQWSNGEVNSTIKVDQAGSYFAQQRLGYCTAFSDTLVISTVQPIEVDLNSFDPICDTAAGFIFDQGIPLGGIYTLNGMESTHFEPSTAQIGENKITYTLISEACVFEDSSSIVLEICSKMANTQSIDVFPNPNQGTFYFEKLALEKITSIQLYDGIGHLVEEITSWDDNLIVLTNQINGLYFLHFNGPKIRQVVKLELYN